METLPSYYNGLFSLLLVQRFRLSVLYEQYETSYLFYVILSFLGNIICYLISVFAFSLVTLSGATTVTQLYFFALFLEPKSLIFVISFFSQSSTVVMFFFCFFCFWN